MSERRFAGVARLVGSVPNTVDRRFAVGDMQLYHLDPPMCGYRVVAASQTGWWARSHHPPDPPDDPVSTTFYGVTGEGLGIDPHQKLPASADGRSPARALADAGYVVW
ncbi:hypothetical protein MFM001_28250 [Mycobacterium sp. MFM001]|uniref:hypothetical protein n=1 Tax=Mycobacterium sp. MFM001 TaxID=2049453 RepID=UPI000DA4D05E|nr:hypothetical protein [Mycobacterium sp. MFM001]GBE66363.1 hypothetical protein MFM001_28250 [Mycobacterium sp. MFM001]